jgi:hypothetical protein
LKLAFREVHIKAWLPPLLPGITWHLRSIDPQPRPDEVSLHPPGYPETLP